MVEGVYMTRREQEACTSIFKLQIKICLYAIICTLSSQRKKYDELLDLYKWLEFSLREFRRLRGADD